MGRYDYNRESHRLAIRMPSGIHERFLRKVDAAIQRQLDAIASGSDDAAHFAQEIKVAGSETIYFPVEDPSSSKKSEYQPDASYWYRDAQYPGSSSKLHTLKRRTT